MSRLGLGVYTIVVFLVSWLIGFGSATFTVRDPVNAVREDFGVLVECAEVDGQIECECRKK